jgi:D-aminoacyl-tRNA deacylase
VRRAPRDRARPKPSRLGRIASDVSASSRRRLKAVVQRVSRAAVRVDDETVAEIGPGLVVLLGVASADDASAAERLAARIARLRIFEDDGGRFDRSVLDTGGDVLVVSQFTLLAGAARQKGRRPDFSDAAPRGQAQPLYDTFSSRLRRDGVPVQTGIFGARMEVELVNDGPVTIVLEV